MMPLCHKCSPLVMCRRISIRRLIGVFLFLILIVCLKYFVCDNSWVQSEVLKQKRCYFYYRDMHKMQKEVDRIFAQQAKFSHEDPKTASVHILNHTLVGDKPGVVGTMRTLVGPIEMYTYGEGDVHISKGILQKHDWEGSNRMTIERLLMADSTLNFIDIGANIGVFTLTAVKHNRKVVAVDANRRNLELINQSLMINPKFSWLVTLVHNAMSDERGKVELSLNSMNIGGSTVSKLAPGSKDVEAVDGVRMDDLVPIIPFKRAILKIDIEGFEHLALAGAHKFFQEIDVPYIMMEWIGQTNAIKYKDEFYGAAFLYNFFKKHGYAPHSVGHELKLPNYFCLWTADILMKRIGPYKGA